MYDKKKIIIMSRLAVYDKNFSDDIKNNEYFRNDYIYKQNARMRFYVFIGCMILTLLYIIHKTSLYGYDVLTMDLKPEAVKIVLFFVFTLIFYTIIGTTIYTVQYQKSRKRLENYYQLLDSLGKIEPDAEETDEYSDDNEYAYGFKPYYSYEDDDDTDDEEYDFFKRLK